VRRCPEGVEIVTPFEDGDELPVATLFGQSAKQPRCLTKGLGVDFEGSQRVGAVGVEPGRDEHEAGGEDTRGGQDRVADRAQEGIAVGPGANGQFNVAPSPAPTPRSVAAPVPGYNGHWCTEA